MSIDELLQNPEWSKLVMPDTWAEYEKPLDMTDWPIEWIRQVPKDVRLGKEHTGIESMMLTK